MFLLRRLFCIFAALICLTGSALSEDYSSWVRLHVVAEGDNAYQQALKMGEKHVSDHSGHCSAGHGLQ